MFGNRGPWGDGINGGGGALAIGCWVVGIGDWALGIGPWGSGGVGCTTGSRACVLVLTTRHFIN